MSGDLERGAAYHASVLGVCIKQMFTSIPPIPKGISLSGKTALVTGSNCGLGFECARQFLELGLQRLIMGVRSRERGEPAAEKLRVEFPAAQIDVWIVDMLSYRSVQSFVVRCEAELPSLDVAILNAGITKLKFERCDETKHEQVLQVNYLSTVLLGILLLPKLGAKKGGSSKSAPGRLTIVVSDLALWSDMTDPGEKGILQSLDDATGVYNGHGRYGETKLMLSMIVSKLPNYVKSEDVVANVINPSLILGTDLGRDLNSSWFQLMLVYTLGSLISRNIVNGVRTFLHASLVLGQDSHGSFVDRIIRPYPPIMYTDAGKQLSNKVWDETMRELQFARVESVLESMRH